MSQSVLLSANANLRGKDLSHVYNLAKNSSDPSVFAMFKKKEPVDNMAKSLLKHRIQALTGKTATDIEEEMGFPSTRAGGGVPLDVLRRLAHFLILDAMGQLQSALASSAERPPDASPKSLARKRGAPEPSPEVEQEKMDTTPSAGPSAKKARTSRKSLMPMASQPLVPINKRGSRRSIAPELMSGGESSKSITETIACKFGPSKAAAAASSSKIMEEEVEEEKSEKEAETAVQDLGLGPNPTPMMIAQKRRSLAMFPKLPNGAGGRSATKVSPVRQAKVTAPATPAAMPAAAASSVTPAAGGSQRKTPVAALLSPDRPTRKAAETKVVVDEVKTGMTADKGGRRKSSAMAAQGSSNKVLANLASPKPGFPGTNGAQIFFAEGDPTTLKHETCVKIAPNFSGANLTILHTPVEWEPMDVFKFTKTIMAINAKASLDSYLLMVGCGLTNASLFRDAIMTQTQHVQFVVFDRADQNLKDHMDGMKLRDSTSFFLLAYFFPGCNNENAMPEQAMVRPGYSNVFKTNSTQDLEDKIVFALSETEDWILDVFCKNREISLAAQSRGRNALAIDPSSEMLFCLKEKAANAAEKIDRNFRKNLDGIIQTF